MISKKFTKKLYRYYKSTEWRRKRLSWMCLIGSQDEQPAMASKRHRAGPRWMESATDGVIKNRAFKTIANACLLLVGTCWVMTLYSRLLDGTESRFMFINQYSWRHCDRIIRTKLRDMKRQINCSLHIFATLTFTKSALVNVLKFILWSVRNSGNYRQVNTQFAA